jgi:HEPN domain-containing protein
MTEPEATRWLAQASEDLHTAQILFDSNRYGPCAFFCQQTAAKALKAVIYHHGEKPWGHSVPSLLDQACVLLGMITDDTPTVEAEALDEHYMRSRYPDARTEQQCKYDRETAETALQYALAILSFAQGRL